MEEGRYSQLFIISEKFGNYNVSVENCVWQAGEACDMRKMSYKIETEEMRLGKSWNPRNCWMQDSLKKSKACKSRWSGEEQWISER